MIPLYRTGQEEPVLASKSTGIFPAPPVYDTVG
jgi:hypothetical protein